MGRDKSRLAFEGTELWRRQVRVLAEAGAQPVALALRRGQRAFDWEGLQLRDAVPDAGPMGALAAALAFSAAPCVAVLAVDLPKIDAAWFRRLMRRCRPGAGAVARGPDGYEPLAAIYPAAAIELCQAHLREGRLSLQALVAALVRHRLMATLPLSEVDRARLTNWNTPRDLV
jgi:molybdopterin-guanine dinucleotide biosynthesis protein A